jgi:predicted transcriptional regulator of viral defense system
MHEPQETRKLYGVPAGVSLARALADAGAYVFTTADARRLAPHDVRSSQIPYLLKLMVDAGWLTRLRRDLYAGTGRLPGGTDVPAFAVATALVSPSAVSHWSALAHHDLTDQVPVVVTATTPGKVVLPSMRRAPGSRETRHVWQAGGVDCQYVTVRESRYFGVESVWIDDRFRVPITDRERTVLDLFAMPRFFGGVAEGMAVLERSRGDLDLEKLLDYGVRYGAVAVTKRLGWALEHVGVSSRSLEQLRRVPAPHYSVFDPGRPRRGHHDRRWMIIENLVNSRP